VLLERTANRAAVREILARVMDAECALARVQLVSGTQAIVAAIAALAGAGDVCSLTGRPYDTLKLALVDHPHALRPGGDGYFEVEWAPGADLDERACAAALRAKPAVVFVQRSRGYAPRPSASIEEIERLVDVCRRESPGSSVVVDNCYGEFVEPLEPCAVGADLVVGSLIKNPGGGMATTGLEALVAEYGVKVNNDRVVSVDPDLSPPTRVVVRTNPQLRDNAITRAFSPEGATVATAFLFDDVRPARA